MGATFWMAQFFSFRIDFAKIVERETTCYEIFNNLLKLKWTRKSVLLFILARITKS